MARPPRHRPHRRARPPGPRLHRERTGDDHPARRPQPPGTAPAGPTALRPGPDLVRAGGRAAGLLFGSIAAEHDVGYYDPAKAAVASFAVGLAADLGPRDIRGNCISPGYIADMEFFNGT
ncbi:SDR family oxidoreductase [Saccharopolyspora hirsuta]|uniref:SDR family oxidoreductase n=1 Tax=Saccharopolyspora hirsuta TaxID=1837 RepID=A0A5M7C5W7_SACHI|nr:SDR family oxidoreductase [Saccharopolyspora hirsuta]